MAKGTGIEIGANAVTVVEIDGSAKKFRVMAAGRATIEPSAPGEERIRAVSAATRSALKAARASKEQIVLGIPAYDVIIREIQLPFTDEEQIRKVIKFESESHLHSCDIDDVVVGFQKFAESGPRSRVLVFAVKKDDIKNALDALDRIGLDPLNVTIDAAGLFGLWRALSDGASEGTNVILDIGETTTTALVVVGDRVRMVRGIRLGTETITRNVASDLGVDAAEARQRAEQFAGKSSQVFAIAGDLEEQEPGSGTTAATLQRDIIRDNHGSFASRLANELRRSLSSVLLDGKLSGIAITGAGSTAAGLETALATAFDVPVKRLGALEGVEHKLPLELQNVVAAPIGLALKALGHDPLGLDFRQEEFRFARKFDRVKWALTMALSLVLFLLVFLLIHELLDGKALTTRQQMVANTAIDLARKKYVPLLNERTAKIIDATNKKAEDVEKRLAAVPADRVVVEAERLYREAAGVLEKKYGYKPGDESSGADSVAVSALVRLSQWLKCFKDHPELEGKFAINRLVVSSTLIDWDMDLAEEADWFKLNTCFKTLPGIEGDPVRASVKPITAAQGAQPGMNFRLAGNKIAWPREGK